MAKANGLTKHQLEIITAAASEKTLDTLEQAEKKAEKERKDNRLFNTKLIVFNYRELKAHCNTIPKQIVEFEESMFDESKLSLERLMQERAKTFAMMQYVDLMLGAYKEHAEQVSGVYYRRYKILNDLYISHEVLSVTKCSEKYHLSVPLIYKDRNKAIGNFSVFLFGLNALRTKGF